MEDLNNLCEQYIYYMFTKHASVLFEYLDELEEESVKLYLTEEGYIIHNMVCSRTIVDWYRWRYPEEPLFTNCIELMKIQQMLVNYYISCNILKNYATIEYEYYEMKILKDYIYYFIHSKPFDEVKILIKTLIKENQEGETEEE